MYNREHFHAYESGNWNATSAKLSKHEELWSASVTFSKSLAVWCGIRKRDKFPGNNTAINEVHPGKKKDNVFHYVQIERLSFEPNQAGFRCSCCVQSVKIQTACVTGVHIQKHVKGTKLRASTEGKKLFLPNPLLLLLLFSFTAPSPLLPFFCSPQACLFSRSLARSPRLENGRKRLLHVRQKIKAQSLASHLTQSSNRVATFFRLYWLWTQIRLMPHWADWGVVLGRKYKINSATARYKNKCQLKRELSF